MSKQKIHGKFVWVGHNPAHLESWLQQGGAMPLAVCGMSAPPGKFRQLALEELPQQENAFDAALLAPEFNPSWLKTLEKTTLSIWVLAPQTSELMAWTKAWQSPSGLLIPLLVTPIDRWSFRFGKRALDILVALVALVASLPFWPLIALAIKLSSPGPVLYAQPRMGLRGRVFRLYKFRTMPPGTDKVLVWGQDERKAVTSVGRFLRKSGLDELPQLINILKGEMSLVGPRPERVEFITTFRQRVPHYMQRHMVPPGVTGWAQIHGWRGDTALEPRIQHDLWYITHWSFWRDIHILFKTIPYVIRTLLSS